jgi:hypothetical protein
VKTVLVNCESHSTAFQLIPLILALQETGRYQVVTYSSLTWVGGDETKVRSLVELFQEHGIELKTNHHFGLEELEDQILRAQDDYEQRARVAIAASPQAKAIAYRGVPVMDLALESMVSWNRDKVRFFAWFERVLEQVRPGLLVNAYDLGSIKKYFVVAARTRGIPTLTIQYAAIPTERVARVASEYCCIWGEHWRELMIRRGTEPDKVFLTGCPALDPYFRPGYDPTPTYRKLGLDPDRRTVLMGAARIDLSHHLEAALEVVSRRDDTQLVLKLHPDTQPQEVRRYQDIIQASAAPALLVQRQPVRPQELLALAQVFASYPISTYVLEALAFGLKILLLRDAEGEYHLDFEEDRFSTSIWSAEDMARELAAALEAGGEAAEPAAAQEYRRRFWYRLDGRATQRMLEVIDAICA